MSCRENPALSMPVRVWREQQQILAARVGQRLQDDGIDDAEDGGVGADAEGHRDDDGEGVARLLAQAPQPIAHVLRHGFDEARQPRVTDVVLDAVDAAEELAGGASRSVRCHALPYVLVGKHVEVEFELGIELALHGAAAEQGADAFQPGGHDAALAAVPQGSCVWRIRATASVIRAQFSRLFGELPASGARQAVVLGLAVVLRRVPFRIDPSLLLEAMECRIERPLIDAQDVLRDLLDAQRDSPAVHRLERQGLQDEHVERSLQEILFLTGHGAILRGRLVECQEERSALVDIRQEPAVC